MRKKASRPVSLKLYAYNSLSAALTDIQSDWQDRMDFSEAVATLAEHWLRGRAQRGRTYIKELLLKSQRRQEETNEPGK